MNQKPHPAVRLLPSLTDFAFLMPVLFLFVRLDGAKMLLGDGDTGWHLRTGEWILKNHAVPRQDLFSFTMPNAPWFAWEWLWDVCFGWLHMHFGLTAVVLGSMLVICTTSLLVFRLSLWASGHPMIAIAAAFLATTGSALHWLARPHLFTSLFVVIWMWILRRGLPRTGSSLPLADARGSEAGGGAEAPCGLKPTLHTALWVLPVLTVLWTNLHGGFFVGIVILLMFAAGSLLNGLFAADAEGLVWARRYALTALGCLAASLVNPYTYRLHAHILSYLRDPYQLDNIQEFQSLSFHAAGSWFFEAMVALALLAAARNFARRRFIPVVLIAGWVHLALISARNIPLFMAVAAPIVAAAAAEMFEEARTANLPAWFAGRLNRFRDALDEFAVVDRLPRVYAVSLAATALVAVGLYSNLPWPKWQAEYDPAKFPVRAVDWLKGDWLKGDRLEGHVAGRRIYSTDQWGDYLTYRLYPRQAGAFAGVFIDGRSDFYGSDFGRDYLDLLGAQYQWQATLDRYSVDTVLIPVSNALASALKESRRWRVDYDDGITIVFTSAAKANTNEFSTTSGKECGAGSSPKEVAGSTQLINVSTQERNKL